MNNLLRLFVVGGICAAAVLIFALGMARDTNAVLGPAQLILFLLALGLYLLPVFVALYRECIATSWIAIVDVLLGWTIVGWFFAFGWAVSGKSRMVPPHTPPPVHPLPSH